jgi:molybdopterin/thiamine biosynthesis adenylyltransferase
MKTFFNIGGSHYDLLKEHLFPGDGKEAVAVALCGRCSTGTRKGLLVHEILPIPYDQCFVRSGDFLHWSTELIRPLLIKASQRKMSLAKIHCHPGGGAFFSRTDNQSDKEFFDSVHGWVNDDGFHASLIMLPDGKLFGRFIEPDLSFAPIDRVRVAGDDVHIWDREEVLDDVPEFAIRTVQAFGEGTYHQLRKMRVVVVGCSGTGSPLIEQLARLGVGELYLVDPDRVEEKNLNRIVNATMEDARMGRFKTDVLKAAIGRMGLGTKVHSCPINLYDDPALLHEIATCDFIFGCMDSVDGRNLLNLLATFYCVPCIDLGVKLVADGMGGVEKICKTIHYLKPGQSLMARGVYSVAALSAANLRRANPREYERRQKEGYIENVRVESPAVISVNTQVAAAAVQELLARIHRYRYSLSNHPTNRDYEIQRWELVDGTYQHESDQSMDKRLVGYIGRGDMEPFLDTPEFSAIKTLQPA